MHEVGGWFVDDPATTEIYTLSLHDALPICQGEHEGREPDGPFGREPAAERPEEQAPEQQLLADRRHEPRHQHEQGQLQTPDRKSTRLNSSHMSISYAVFCLKKKKKNARVLR